MKADKKAENGRMDASSRAEKGGSSNGRVEKRESSGHPSEPEDLNYRVRCDYCGNALRRLARQGFLQTKIYSRFGYYPWECPLCREPMMVKQQHRYKMESEPKPTAAGAVAAGKGAAGLGARGSGVGDDATPTPEVVVEFESGPKESEPTIMAERETNPEDFQLTAMDVVGRKPAKSKASRARATGSNGARPGSTRSREAGSGMSEQTDSDQKTA